jgi:hypothetical protein
MTRNKTKLKHKKVTIERIRNKSLLEIAPLGKAPKGKDALKAREYMEKNYSRF